MAKPAKSLSERKKELIDDQEYLSEKEKKKAKEAVDKTAKEKEKKKEETRKILEEEQKEFEKAAEKSAAGEEIVLFKEEDFEEDEKDEKWYKEFEEGLKEDDLSYADRRKQQRSDTVFNTYNTGEEWLMSEDEDDLVKGFINNFRSAIGTGVEDLAYAIKDYAPWYKPAETVLKNNTAGKIEEQAQKQFKNAKASGVNGNIVDFLDAASKGLGYSVFGLKAGNYVQDGADAFGEYRALRDSGYTKEEATLAMAKKAPMIILSAKADDYIGKKSGIGGVLYGKSGIINDYSDATKKFISKQEDAVHKQMNNLKTDVLNKKLPKSEVKNFEIRIDKRIREITNSGYSQEEMEEYFGDLRKTLSELYNQKTKFLPVKEYAHVMSETATHTPTAKWKNGDFSKPIKNDLYDVDNKGFSEFKITSKKPIY